MDYATLSADELVIACGQSDDPAAWQEFVQRFHRLIATVALRVARRWGEPSPQVIDDLVQETYLKLCADNFQALRAFKPHHPDAFYRDRCATHVQHSRPESSLTSYWR
jgi:RNA polymerase sigma-70 factor, ECF subfamily